MPESLPARVGSELGGRVVLHCPNASTCSVDDGGLGSGHLNTGSGCSIKVAADAKLSVGTA